MADGISYQHPGVYIQELPGVPTIQGVSTSIPVFIGLTEKLADEDAYVARQVTSWGDYQTRYGANVWGAYASFAVYEFFMEGGALCYVIGLPPTDLPQTSKSTAKVTVVDCTGSYTFSAASAGSWANTLQIAILDAGPVPSAGKASNYFSINVMVAASALAATAATVWDKLLSVYVKNNSIKNVNGFYTLESFGVFTASSLKTPSGGGLCPLQLQINSASMFIRVTGVKPTTGQQGARSVTPHQMSSGSTIPLSSLYAKAIPVLASVPDASLVATPDAAVVELTTQMTSITQITDVITSVMAQCQKLPNLFYVIDAPYVSDPTNTTNIVTFVAGGTNTSPLIYENAAIYYPWPLVLNQSSGTNVPIPPSGPVLGRYATTDLVAGVHVSPAGVRTGRIATAMALTGWLTDSDQDLLNPHGINAIRNIPGYGITIYGARTLAAGQWQYVAVRRFVTFVEQSLRASLEWVVFEPNSELLWATVVREITAFLTLLWHQGALFGSTADDAFFVTCDVTNNPPSLRTQGVLNIDVGLAVLYPAEFVVIRVAQMTSTSSSGS